MSTMRHDSLMVRVRSHSSCSAGSEPIMIGRYSRARVTFHAAALEIGGVAIGGICSLKQPGNLATDSANAFLPFRTLAFSQPFWFTSSISHNRAVTKHGRSRKLTSKATSEVLSDGCTNVQWRD